MTGASFNLGSGFVKVPSSQFDFIQNQLLQNTDSYSAAGWIQISCSSQIPDLWLMVSGSWFVVKG